MSTLIEIASAALQLSVVYWIVNLGFVYLYRTTGVLNFAQGQMLLLGSFILVVFTQKFGLPLIAAFPFVILASILLGVLIYLFSLRYLQGAGQYVKVIETFMVSVILTQVVGLIWGVNSYVVTMPHLGHLSVGGKLVPTITVVTAVVLLVMIAIVQYLVTHARWGLAMRAAASNGALATYYGIRSIRLGAIAWAMAFVCASVGGLVYVESAPVVYGMASVGFSAFPAAVLGGMDSVPGAIVGGLLVAIVQSVTSFFFGGSLADASSFALVIVVLVVRPYGLLGKSKSIRL